MRCGRLLNPRDGGSTQENGGAYATDHPTPESTAVDEGLSLNPDLPVRADMHGGNLSAPIETPRHESGGLEIGGDETEHAAPEPRGWSFEYTEVTARAGNPLTRR